MHANKQPDDRRLRGQEPTHAQQFDQAGLQFERAGSEDFELGSIEQERVHCVLSHVCSRLGVDPGFADRTLSKPSAFVHDTTASLVARFEEIGTRMAICHVADSKLFQFARADNHREWSFDAWQAVGAKLFRLYQAYEAELTTLLCNVTADDTAVLLKRFHTVPAISLTPQHLNLLLNLTDEKHHGEVSRHSEDEYRSFFERGGERYEATDPAALRAVFSRLHFKPGLSFYDLGSGYGHPILYGANLRLDGSFTGIELMSARVNSARRAAERLGLANAYFQACDVTACDFSAADVVFLFNPFTEEVAEHVSEKLAAVAQSKPLLIIDYFGAITSMSPGCFCQVGEAAHMYELYTSPKYRSDVRRMLIADKFQ